ncbi:MAG: hypothetical protein PF450_07320 [Bacteroidales bacterium]|jgi:hypothetical protein|nr:hypothetical protein [Bacteroidales bacterium]
MKTITRAEKDVIEIFNFENPKTIHPSILEKDILLLIDAGLIDMEVLEERFTEASKDYIFPKEPLTYSPRMNSGDSNIDNKTYFSLEA